MGLSEFLAICGSAFIAVFFLARYEYSMAVEKFKLAVAVMEAAEARDALANGYIQWAADFRAKEDFLGALDQLKLAQEAGSTGAMKQSVDNAFTETYAAFSSSTGQQARQAMKEALKLICEKKKQPELPIFGLDQDTVRFGVYGIEDKLPDDVTANTPGEMHYVACIKVEERLISSYNKVATIRTPDRDYFYIGFKLLRLKIIWHLTLRKAVDAQEYAAKTFEGGAPPPFPARISELGNQSFYGTPPLLTFAFVSILQAVLEPPSQQKWLAAGGDCRLDYHAGHLPGIRELSFSAVAARAVDRLLIA